MGSEGRQMKLCWIEYLKNSKNPPFQIRQRTYSHDLPSRDDDKADDNDEDMVTNDGDDINNVSNGNDDNENVK